MKNKVFTALRFKLKIILHKISIRKLDATY